MVPCLLYKGSEVRALGLLKGRKGVFEGFIQRDHATALRQEPKSKHFWFMMFFCFWARGGGGGRVL